MSGWIYKLYISGVAVPHVKCLNVEVAHNVSGGDGSVCRIPKGALWL